MNVTVTSWRQPLRLATSSGSRRQSICRSADLTSFDPSAFYRQSRVAPVCLRIGAFGIFRPNTPSF
ncbi:hypothetical protein AB3X96_40810 [Paraburkholderia sp. BR13439]|uniref:hypothetical protein n=1 Tax=unclassified Paraburkholderia TaxID=2615204 RepID=UPI0034CE12E8